VTFSVRQTYIGTFERETDKETDNQVRRVKERKRMIKKIIIICGLISRHAMDASKKVNWKF